LLNVDYQQTIVAAQVPSVTAGCRQYNI